MSDLSKSPARIAGMFDAIAARYDFLNHLLSANLDRRWRRQAVASLGLTGRERVLDLCTGTGDLAIAARVANPPAARVVGVDFAGAMLRVGASKVRERGLAGITLVRGDATCVPLAEGAVDALTIGFGIRNVERLEVACREMHRVLTSGGRLAILEFAVPTTPGFRQIYGWYLNGILPRLGRLLSGNSSAYRYLPDSVGAFATPAELVKLLRQAGFADVSAIPLTFGAVYLYTGKK